MKKYLAALAALGMTTTLAVAQTATTTTTITAPTSMSGSYLTTVDSKFWLGSKTIGMPVYTAATDERIGEINNIVIDPNGSVVALVVGVGGFLGVGERDVAVRFASFKPTTDAKGNMKLTLATSKDELKNAAEVKLQTKTNY